MRVVLASKSETKIEAVLEAFGDASIIFEPIAVPSDVNAQPMDDETLKGAFNRFAAAMEEMPGADLYISIENGIFLEHRNYIDRAAIVMGGPFIKRQHFYSEGVLIPKDAVNEAIKRGLDKTTVGEVLFEQGRVKNAWNPHLDLRAKSRTIILTETLKKALVTLNLPQSLQHPAPAAA